MSHFLWNIALAAVWAFALGELSAFNLAVGFAMGYAVLWLGRGVLGTGGYCGRLPRLGALLGFFAWELLLANLRVARDVVTPGNRMRPGIVAVPLDAQTDGEITLLASMITLTPGTLCLGVSPDRRLLYVHAMYIDDVDAIKHRLKAGFERRILAVLR